MLECRGDPVRGRHRDRRGQTARIDVTMSQATNVVGLIVAVVSQDQGEWSILFVDSGERLPLLVPFDRGTNTGQVVDPITLLGRRISYQDGKVEFLDGPPPSPAALEPRFPLGRLSATPAALRAIADSGQ